MRKRRPRSALRGEPDVGQCPSLLPQGPREPLVCVDHADQPHPQGDRPREAPGLGQLTAGSHLQRGALTLYQLVQWAPQLPDRAPLLPHDAQAQLPQGGTPRQGAVRQARPQLRREAFPHRPGGHSWVPEEVWERLAGSLPPPVKAAARAPAPTAPARPRPGLGGPAWPPGPAVLPVAPLPVYPAALRLQFSAQEDGGLRGEVRKATH